MLKKEPEEILDGLEHLYARERMMEKKYQLTWGQVLVIVTVLAIGIHALVYLNKLSKCEQMLLHKTKTEHTVCDFPGSLDLEDSNKEKNYNGKPV